MSREKGLLQKILYLLSAREKRRGALVLGMVVVMAMLEVIGVASIMPFLSVLGNPEVVRSNPYLVTVYEALGFSSVDAFLAALGVATFTLILFSTLFRAFTYHAMNRFIEMRRHSISERLLETYLRQPYAFFLSRNSSDMAKSILSEVDQLVINVFRPGLMMVAYSVVTVAILTLLIVMDPILAAVVACAFGGLYGLIYLCVHGFLGRAGQARVGANRERYQAAGEALGGIKDIKLLGRENAYLQRFRGPSVRFAQYLVVNQTASQVPGILVEAVAFGSIIVLTLWLLATHGGAGSGALGGILPLLGLYAFAGLRLKPALQRVYQGFAKLRFGVGAIEAAYQDLIHRASLAELQKCASMALTPKKAVALQNVSYTYPHTPTPALVEIDLEIPVGSSVGLVGTTGAGKTTLVDVLLGLLRPTRGAISVDGQPVTDENLRAWQQALGYVPQQIFLTDATVTENIALGTPPKHIDQDQVVRCARMAQLHDFIMEEMPQQYATMVGERGVRLSGGQRQRIGIARALYHNPSVLVFDEATSALDSLTERAVMEAIEGLRHEKTIFLIAHRLSTVRSCDKLVLLDKGHMIAAGSFEELKIQSQKFRSMLETI